MLCRPAFTKFDGRYLIVGEDQDCGTLFSLSFGMAEISGSGAGGDYAFILPAPGVSAAAARRAVPEPGLEVVISRGVPSSEDWER